MTDQELIARLEEHGPAGLNPAELELLRERLPLSAELQQFVFSEVQLEEAVSGALARPKVTVESVLQQAAKASPARRWAARIGWLLPLIVLVAGGWWYVEQQRPPKVEPVAMAETPRKKEASPKKEDTATPPAAASVATDTPAKPNTPAILPTTPAVGPQEVPGPPMPVAAKPVEDASPWPELDATLNPPRPLIESASLDLTADSGQTLNELRRWLEPAPGLPHRFLEDRRNNVAVCGFDGMVKLKPRWSEQAVLRMAVFDCDGFAMHLWAGDHGVTLICHQQYPQSWSAYVTTRAGTSPKPLTWSLAATDDDRYERTSAGPVELRWQAGALVLSRGTLRLLTVPLDELPSQVFFEKRALFREFSMFLGEPLPEEEDALAPSVMVELPASMRWEPHVGKGSEFEIRDDGSVKLVAEKAAEPAWSVVKLPKVSLYEFVVQVDEAQPGTGVCFADETGKPLHILGFSRDRRAGGTTFGYQPPNAGGFDSHHEFGPRPVPAVSGRKWLRMVFGCGTLKTWTSGDGKHWSRIGDPIRNLRGTIRSVGLIAFRHNEPRSIVLRSLQVRELTPLTELAAADLRDIVPERVSHHAGELSAWLAAVIDTLPADAEPTEWRRTCAVQTLANLPPLRLGNGILNGLLEDVAVENQPVDRKLRVLNQAAELFDAWDAPETFRLIKWYERLGLQVAREGDPRPWTDVGQKLITAPLWTPHRFSPLIESLVRAEVYGYLYQDDWAAADEVCDRIRFLAQPSHPDAGWPGPMQDVKLLVDWVQGTPEQALGNRRGNARRQAARQRPLQRTSAVKYRHPLVVDLSKEGFNTLGEVQSALTEGSWKEACQVITTVNVATAQGLLPDASDGQLLVSLPQAVDAAMRDYPLLKQTMVSEFGPTAMLRVNEAIADGNADALEAAAVQFHGTEAAAAAHRWLGDRWLAAGEFARAAAAFQAALATAALPQRGELQGRLRLTSALLGRDAGVMPAEPVRFNDQQLSPEEFEQLIADLKGRSTTSTGQKNPVAIDALPPAQLPKPVRYDLGPRLPLPLDKGKNPNNWPRGEEDWVGYQMAGQVVGDLLYLSNRFTLLAVDLNGPSVKWQTSIGGDQGDAHGWHLTRMKPVIAGDRVFVRRLSKDGPELAALDATNGSLIWRARIPDIVLSDPLVMEDSLLVLSATAAQDGLLHVSLTTVKPQSGEIEVQRPLVRLMDAWYRQVPCDVSLVGGRIVATLGGSLMCCDVTGQVLWVRRQTWAPLAYEPRTWEQPVHAPTVVGERIITAQPGVMAVDCLESSSGRKVWQQVVPDLRRVVAVTGGRVIVEGHRRLLGLAIDDGSRQWELPVERLQSGQIAATNGQILLVRTQRFRDNEPARPQLAWFDATTGQETALWWLDGLQEKLPQVGPLLTHKDDLLLLWSKHDKDVDRELAILKPTAAPAFAHKAVDHPLQSWVQSQADPRVVQAVECLLADWLCLGTADDKDGGFLSEHRGQQDVCRTLAGADRPVTFVRRLAVPPGKKTRLVVLAGCQSGGAWTLDVRVAGQTLETVRIEDASTPSGWKDLHVDLSSFAGQTISLVVEQQFSGKPAHAYWKRLDVISE